MSLRAIPPGFDPATVAAIDARLDAIERDEGVRILLAVESGSRAWGFPSPDSDYDCRFLYVRPRDDYLSLWPKRDVIEMPLEGDLDVNGWDLGKALKLMLKGNAVVLEWLRSAVVYRGDAEFRADMLALAERHVDRRLIARHYLHFGERQRRTWFGDGKDIAFKKLFYAIRPAAALRWLRLHPDVAVPPMHFPSLLAESEPPVELAGLVADLMERKAVTRELGQGPLPEPIARFVAEEFGAAEAAFGDGPSRLSVVATIQADNLFARIMRTAPRSAIKPVSKSEDRLHLLLTHEDQEWQHGSEPMPFLCLGDSLPRICKLAFHAQSNSE